MFNARDLIRLKKILGEDIYIMYMENVLNHQLCYRAGSILDFLDAGRKCPHDYINNGFSWSETLINNGDYIFWLQIFQELKRNHCNWETCSMNRSVLKNKFLKIQESD